MIKWRELIKRGCVSILTVSFAIVFIPCFSTFWFCTDEDEFSPDDSLISPRPDGAVRLTYSPEGQSAQNPAYSPDGKFVLFTRFVNGYNEIPSELVIINVQTGAEEIIIPAQENVEHISVPGPSWVSGKICWSSDIAGFANEIYTANDDGTNSQQITNHPESEGYYHEPVFNPVDTNNIIFEYGPADDNKPHQIALVEIVDNDDNIVTLLTDGSYDDRLPNWSYNGQTILFQRADPGEENWRIYTGTIDQSGSTPVLVNVTLMDQPKSDNTDNSWYYNNEYVLSSTYYTSDMPNIFAFSASGNESVRITNSSTCEDGAPSCSYDEKWIAFESHLGDDEENPSEIFIIESPLGHQ